MSDVKIGPVQLPGSLVIPDDSKGLVVFVHGSGSSRFSPRNQYIARQLQHGGLATLLFDLLTEEESKSRENVFDIALLTERVLQAIDWIEQSEAVCGLPVGLFGASTGAAAALVASTKRPKVIGAVVSRGGRPDLAKPFLTQVSVPTLLIVGECDEAVLEFNREAQRSFRCESKLDVVSRATHLFEEPGTLERVGELTREWFVRYLPASVKEAKYVS